MIHFRLGPGVAGALVFLILGAFFLILAACTTEPDSPATPASATIQDQPPGPQTADAPSPGPVGSPTASMIVPGSLRDFQENVGDQINFEYDRAELTSAAQDTLRKQAAWLLRYPSVTLVIEGHCDERGTREYNLALGARRASAVMTYLLTTGVNGARLETVSYGKERPSCTQSAEVCWQQNRRGVSIIKAGAVAAGT